MEQLLNTIVQSDQLHSKWLNALSFMENTGARKISACEDPYGVTFLQLKHAAEEHRHAYYLKKQIKKLSVAFKEDYSIDSLLAANHTRQYLQRLDIFCVRYLKKELQLTGQQLKFAAYLLVTYAIELRADLLYPIYQEILEKHNSKVMVKSIIVEEQGHLEEMIAQLNVFSDKWQQYAEVVIRYEQELSNEWLSAILNEIKEQ
ncbi:hypothetical protein [Myroides marinus]|uniref:hypothetical protein n=1 Tax=Myroides marinus TaxID=703342 RepID=UPI00074207D7|nr:hypothetical protein [Myroides marinus]KUF45128.1 hypothetical protein AS361_14975 [Myroides marinus]MDM1534138.1 hypothetical protein [Myroides marinus]MDM1541087.1 hypothetical protein [Myroides marinus]